MSNFANSIVYGGLATILCFLIGYPLAYGIAFRGGRYKSLLLFLVIAPFFTSFLIRTISWRIILGNDGPFLSIIRDGLGLVPDNFSIIGTPLAVVGGLTYQFLPFMVLPLYVSLEKVDRRLIEAAQDLYAGPWRRGGADRRRRSSAALLAWRSRSASATAASSATTRPPASVGGGRRRASPARSWARSSISESFIRVIFPLVAARASSRAPS